MFMGAEAMVDLIIKSVFHLGNADSYTLVRGLDVRLSVVGLGLLCEM